MNEMRKLMEAVQLDEYDRREPIYIEYRDPDGDFIVKYNHSRGYYAEGDGVDRAPSFENLDDAIEHGELCVSSGLGCEIDEDHYNAPDTRKITNKLHELMDEQMLDPRAVADAALTYMSEADVADMAHSNELISDEDGFEESIDDNMFPENEDDVSTCECGSDDISKWTDDQGRKNVACNECGDEWMY